MLLPGDIATYKARRSQITSLRHQQSQLTTMTFTKSQLVDLCEQHGLPKRGKKDERIARLKRKGLLGFKRELPDETEDDVENQQPAKKAKPTKKICSICDFQYSYGRFRKAVHASIDPNAREAYNNVCSFCWENDIRCSLMFIT